MEGLGWLDLCLWPEPLDGMLQDDIWHQENDRERGKDEQNTVLSLCQLIVELLLRALLPYSLLYTTH